ncbi:MAG TPA: DUF4349 domain-containing protein [Anaerolineaceae bacterium]|jgi:uncharacterized protein YihD (DUF1040 family)|nr:DUF4349 domain-containing protein [Anaerolineaceae bacterium]HNS07388.1 DUF4349 domain-containing protein [Anaerolineaceae bacterium]HNW13723.1 DUF4349 domain-containing protein [Anaerolineaceae bacterium]HOE02789.1 DUF4349 domain-containing protein [Anaerolineaceae bacterium]HOS53429.1 DUF4349 domain-containing protein [Anaerolineaceae bacterium]
MKTKSVLIGIVILSLTLSGCASKSYTANNLRSGGVEDYAMKAAPMVEPMEPMLDSYAESAGSPGIAAAGVESVQMIMMNASLSIAVDDPAATLRDVQQLAKGMGGYTVSSNLYKSYTSSGVEVPQANLIIRVPAERLDEAMQKIKDMTGDPKKYTLNESVSGQDVTKEYTDLKSRLRNLEEADAKLSEFYENAANTEDALSIYSQKMQVTEQIEIIKGQIKYYDESVSTSSITLQIQSKETIAPITVAGWQPSGVARDALQALLDFGKGLVNFLIWLVILVVPIVLLFGLPIFFLVRWLKRRSTARKLAALERRAQENKSEPTPPIPTKK